MTSINAGQSVILLVLVSMIQASILLFTPYFSRVILQLQLQPQEFVRGLAFELCLSYSIS